MSSLTSQLTALQAASTITGFALVTAQGLSQASGEFEGDHAEGLSQALQDLIAPFFSPPSEPPTTHTFNGVKLQVIQQSDSHYVALSKQRQLGLVALNTPLGVVLASFDRSTYPAAALTAVQAAVQVACAPKAPVRQQCATHSGGAAVAAAAARGPVSTSS